MIMRQFKFFQKNKLLPNYYPDDIENDYFKKIMYDEGWVACLTRVRSPYARGTEADDIWFRGFYDCANQ